MLPFYQTELPEAGCDEAGRGCLAGPVFAAAVILPPNFYHDDLNDSKQMNAAARARLRVVIEREALAWSVQAVSVAEIDKINILKASMLGMHRALLDLSTPPGLILVDGNRFIPFQNIPHLCVVKGDGKYAAIAAASVLAKTHRDEHMEHLHAQFPQYDWQQNKGYPTEAHREAIRQHGPCVHHRRSFRLLPEGEQLEIW